jgi:hypothetical protein
MTVSTGRFTRSLLALCAAGALVAGCGDDDDDASSGGESAKPTTFAVTATAQGAKKKALEFPATVKAGLVTLTLTNSDTAPRSAQILRVTDDHTVDDVLKVVNADSTKIPEWMQDGGGLGAVKPGESKSATQNLAPGRYVIWDDEGGDDEDTPGNDELGAKGEFMVTGEAVDAELPSVPATVTATDEGTDTKDKTYDFEFKGLKPGVNKVRFENTGDQLHHALFFPIIGDKTIKDVEKAFASEKGPPPVDFEKGVGTTVIDGGIAQNIELELPAGRYAVICFLSDRKGGKSHAEEGMLKELTVE